MSERLKVLKWSGVGDAGLISSLDMISISIAVVSWLWINWMLQIKGVPKVFPHKISNEKKKFNLLLATTKSAQSILKTQLQ